MPLQIQDIAMDVPPFPAYLCGARLPYADKTGYWQKMQGNCAILSIDKQYNISYNIRHR